MFGSEGVKATSLSSLIGTILVGRETGHPSSSGGERDVVTLTTKGQQRDDSLQRQVVTVVTTMDCQKWRRRQ